jgi:transposase
MVLERTSVGLDVHARSIVAGVIDGITGEIRSERLAPATEAVVSWLRSLPGPLAVAYEAGPTGFGLARALAAVGVRCVVVAPSKLERPPGDRVKTDRRDAERLARLLRIGELPVVRVPTVAEEAARDLLRAREDARGDLMRARHRLSKLLLRQGLVWPDSAWTQAHQRWLRKVALELNPLACGWRSMRRWGRCLGSRRAGTGWTVPSTSWPGPTCMGAAGRPAGLSAWGRDADRVGAGGGGG